MPLLEPDLLDRSTNLETHEEYLTLLAEVRARTDGLTRQRVQTSMESSLPAEQAAALLYCAAHACPPEPPQIEDALTSESREVLASAALCLAACLPNETELQRSLLLGLTLNPPKISRNAGYFLIEAMRVSGDPCFAPILLELFEKHYHFYPARLTFQALNELHKNAYGTEENRSHRSISVSVSSDSKLLIHTDERYGGGSNCIHCRFFPCRINQFYDGGIEDCKLWNRVNPSELGEFIDLREGWGKHSIEESAPFSIESMLQEARSYLARGQARPAIPRLCLALIEDNFQSSASLPAWVLLARCFSMCSEPVLAFIMMREVAVLKGILANSAQSEREELARFVDDPVVVLGHHFGEKGRGRLGLRALGYKKADLYTKALDCYAKENVRKSGQFGGTWFEMGECHLKLGELHLAELCMRRGALKVGVKDRALREKFLEGAEAARTLRALFPDPGLALGRRAVDRAADDPPDLCI